LLISALDHFNLGTTVDDDTFMSTMSKSTSSGSISKKEFHSIINNVAFTQFFFLHSFIYSRALFVHSQCSKIISTKNAKTNFSGTDREEMLTFQ
jgi:hypothetical protein